jgi:hypothetical protein
VEYNPNRLLQFIGRTAVLSPLAFWLYNRQHLAGLHLNEARLSNLMLAEAQLASLQCCEAALVGINLENANLSGANLSGSNLTRANLQGANLQDANLTGVDLRWANLTGANLKGALLANACLAHANLDSEGTELAQEGGAFFSVTEFQVLQQLARQEESLGPAATTDPKLFYGDVTIAVATRPGGKTWSAAASEPASTEAERLEALEDTASLSDEATEIAASQLSPTPDIPNHDLPNHGRPDQALPNQALPKPAPPNHSFGSHHPSPTPQIGQDTLNQYRETDTLSQVPDGHFAKSIQAIGQQGDPEAEAEALRVSLAELHAADETMTW